MKILIWINREEGIRSIRNQ